MCRLYGKLDDVTERNSLVLGKGGKSMRKEKKKMSIKRRIAAAALAAFVGVSSLNVSIPGFSTVITDADETEIASQLSEETPETTEEETEEVAEPEEEKTADVVADNKFDEAKNNDEEGKNSLASTMSLEELEAKLAEEQDRLKANEKELRQCKKEFLPLRRVKKTLENDEKKLRRKEALVAKQKVVLYGVNNYADIDEEKAKKLAEDLDLLDGLKLSVQHCEEVMAKNEERYPLLEKIYNLLTSQNTEIKDDIKKLQEAIDELKSSDTDSATDSTDAE